MNSLSVLSKSHNQEIELLHLAASALFAEDAPRKNPEEQGSMVPSIHLISLSPSAYVPV